MLFAFKPDFKETVYDMYICILQMKLEIYRTFVENRDGTYDLYEMPKTPESMEESYKGKNPMPIRPFELKTFLKVGKDHWIWGHLKSKILKWKWKQ